MRKLSLVLSLGLALLSAVPAFADGVTITVTPWLAPNAYGSPSYNTAVSNSIYAQMNGLSTYGAAGPTQYNAQTTPVTAAQTIVTGFNSWMGVANPTGAYSQELGNRMSFGIAIRGNGTQFSISELSFNSVSTSDTPTTLPANMLGFGFATGSYAYSDSYEGVVYNPDGSIKTIYNSSNPTASTTLVDAVFGRGSGDSYAAYCNPCTPDQQQQAIDDAAAYPGYDYTFTGTYTLTDSTGTSFATGSGTFDVLAPTPEPSSLVLLGTGAVGLAGALRRRFIKL